MIQLSSRHLAVAVGSLSEQSNIEIHDISTSRVTEVLKGHTNMIDSMLKFNIGKKLQAKFAPWTQFLISCGRDGQIILWKLMDGVLVQKCSPPLAPTFDKIQT